MNELNDYDAFQHDRELEEQRLEEICNKARAAINDDEFFELMVALGIVRRKA